MMRKVLLVGVCVLLVGIAREASAQTAGASWLDRGYFNLNVGFGSGSETLTDAATFVLYGEGGNRRTTQAVETGTLIDFSVGSRVWQNVSVGLGFHRAAGSGQAAVEGSVPHPLFFNAHRPLALGVDGLERSERAFHLQVGYMLVLNERLNVHLTAGPSFFRVRQDVVSDISFTEVAPFTTVNAAPLVEERSDSATGVNAGVDVAYLFYDGGDVKVGGGLFVRYAGATAQIPILQNTIETDLGGLQVGFGARVRF